MDKKIRAKWIRALRSGKYKQTRDRIKHRDAYCCLGVLCTVIKADWVKDKWGDMQAQIKGVEITSCNKLTPCFVDKVGLTDEQQNTLAELNDGAPPKNIKKHSFKQIADYIKANL